MTSGEIAGTLFLFVVAAGLYAAGWLEHRNLMRWKARRDAERRAQEVAAE